MSDTYVPLISSGVAGPLGVLHLPLHVAESLAGSDGQTCFRLSRHRPRVRRHDLRRPWARGTGGEGLIKKNKPTYPQFEGWVKANAKSLTPQAIDKHNAAVRGYNHDERHARRSWATCRMAADSSAPKDAVNLNNLDDWHEFHKAVLQ